MTMSENPPKQDNQAAPEEKTETVPKVEGAKPSPESVEPKPESVEPKPESVEPKPESVEPKPESEENVPQEATEADVVEVEKPDESAPEKTVVESIEVEEIKPVKKAPYVPPSRTRTPRIRSMRDLVIGKVVVNITVGASGEPLDRAMTILENLTEQKPVQRRAKQTIRTWGVRKNEPIACMVTLRREKAEALLKKTFPAVGNRVNLRSFDMHGNFAFGIREHIDIPGQRYDPNLGIIGMDIMATVERPGYRVSRKRRAKGKVSQSHRVTREESIEFIKRSFGVEVGLPDE
ncbi:MAG: 50S ribosomal protein L5 [Candidatus Bathyarchaeia archaeon]